METKKSRCSGKYICLIVNPVAGKGKPLKILPDIENVLKKNRLSYTVHYTRKNGDGIILAKTCKKDGKACLVIAVGGDGTLHEVVNGIYPSNLPVGYIPAGSGNDYAREMGIPKEPLLALKNLLNMYAEPIDIGKINDRYFLNVASLGFDGLVALYANQSRFKKMFGKAVYLYGVLKALFTFKPEKVEVIVDGKPYSFHNVWLIAIANHRYYGGGMVICPQAKNHDGYLDICIIKDLNHLKFLLLFPTIFFGKHVQYPMVETLKGKRIEIISNNHFVHQADGEILNVDSIRLESVKQGLIIVK